jgi:hypothetical protein
MFELMHWRDRTVGAGQPAVWSWSAAAVRRSTDALKRGNGSEAASGSGVSQDGAAAVSDVRVAHPT